jgi:prophage regulatory protein
MRVLRFPELKDRKGIDWKRKTIIQKIHEGKFPRPMNLGDNTVAWDEAEIDEWILARKHERDLSWTGTPMKGHSHRPTPLTSNHRTWQQSRSVAASTVASRASAALTKRQPARPNLPAK